MKMYEAELVFPIIFLSENKETAREDALKFMQEALRNNLLYCDDLEVKEVLRTRDGKIVYPGDWEPDHLIYHSDRKDITVAEADEMVKGEL